LHDFPVVCNIEIDCMRGGMNSGNGNHTSAAGKISRNMISAKAKTILKICICMSILLTIDAITMCHRRQYLDMRQIQIRQPIVPRRQMFSGHTHPVCACRWRTDASVRFKQFNKNYFSNIIDYRNRDKSSRIYAAFIIRRCYGD